MIKHIITTSLLLALTTSSTELKSNQELLINEKYRDLTKKISCPQITAKELKNLQPESYILIDTRSPKEQAVSTLPKSISAKTYLENPEVYQSKIKVAYCTIGYRSGIFAEKHHKLKVINLIGGVLAWSHIGGTFMKNGKTTKRVHTYSKKWNFLNKKYQAVYD